MFIIWEVDSTLEETRWALAHPRFASQQRMLCCVLHVGLHNQQNLLCSQVSTCETLK